MTLPEATDPEASEHDAAPPGGSLGRSTATVLAAVAVGVVCLLVAGGIWLAARPEPAGRVHDIEIPAGTADRIAAGETVNLVPRELHLAVNDSVMIQNHDDEVHHVGPFVVTANGTVVHRFDRPGRFQGACELHAEDTFTIVVD